jgi:hypothetical protein
MLNGHHRDVKSFYMGVKKMVGKLSDDRLLSGSRIPVLYLWQYGDGHPYSTPNDELRKSINAKHGQFDRFDMGEPGIVGNLLEPPLVESACEMLGLPEPELSPPVYTAEDGSFQCSLDGLTHCPVPTTIFADDVVEIHGGESSIEISGPIPIECKCTSDFRRDEIPLYRGPVQLQMQMMAVNAKFGILITLHRSIERHIKIYRADPEMQDRIRQICHDFRDRVETENMYKPVNADDASKTYSSAAGDIELAEYDDRVERLLRLREDEKSIKNEIDALQTEIMQQMQDAETARCGRYLVKWPMRNYKAQAQRVVPAKDAYSVRLKSLQIKTL